MLISKKPQYYNNNTDLGSDSNLLMFKVIVIYYTNLGGISNTNSNLLMFKVLVIYYTNVV